jgi:hypothetical protein
MSGVKTGSKARNANPLSVATTPMVAQECANRGITFLNFVVLRLATRFAHQFRQLGDVRRNPPRLIAGDVTQTLIQCYDWLATLIPEKK